VPEIILLPKASVVHCYYQKKKKKKQKKRAAIHRENQEAFYPILGLVIIIEILQQS